MAYNALNNLIDAYIYPNGVQAITGSILNNVLKAMVSQLGGGYNLMGVAAPASSPAVNDEPQAYFAATAGTYTNFDGIVLAAGEVAVLLTSGNGSWSKQTIYNVPTGTADLSNTAGFITSAVNSLVNYYTKTEIDTALAGYTTTAALATALADYYNKASIDAQMATRYTKTEVDTKFGDYYRKAETYDKDEVDSIVAAISRQEYIVAWDGLSTPDTSAIPAGVTVTYSGNTYTGVLAASASTVNKIYMVWNGVAYDMYGTSQDGGYSWVPMGTTTVDLSQYATKAEVNQLEAKVRGYAPFIGGTLNMSQGESIAKGIGSTVTWNASGTAKLFYVESLAGETLTIVANAYNISVVAFLSSNDTSHEYPEYITGETGAHFIQPGQTEQLTIPAGTRYLFVETSLTTDRTPQSVTISENISDILHRTINLERKFEFSFDYPVTQGSITNQTSDNGWLLRLDSTASNRCMALLFNVKGGKKIDVKLQSGYRAAIGAWDGISDSYSFTIFSTDGQYSVVNDTPFLVFNFSKSDNSAITPQGVVSNCEFHFHDEQTKEIEHIVDDVDALKTIIYQLPSTDISVELGTLNSTTGQESDNDQRARSGYYHVNGDFKVVSNIPLNVFYYNDNYVYNRNGGGWYDGEISSTYVGYIRVVYNIENHVIGDVESSLYSTSSTNIIDYLLLQVKETPPIGEIVMVTPKINNNIVGLDWIASQNEDSDVLTDSPAGVIFPPTYSPIGKPTKVLAMFHGHGGHVASDCLGYTNASWTAWRNVYLNAGYAVMDINGYAAFDNGGYTNRPWGNWSAIQTIRKTFENLREHYNVYDKFYLHGYSMGGQNAISYAMNFPNDVAVVGAFEPAFPSIPYERTDLISTIINSFGYASQADMIADNYARLVGYSLPLGIQVFDDGANLPNAAISFDFTQVTDKYLLGKFPVPIRIWQGSVGDVINPNIIKNVVNALRNGGCDASIRMVNGANHDFFGSASQAWIRDESLLFFNRY